MSNLVIPGSHLVVDLNDLGAVDPDFDADVDSDTYALDCAIKNADRLFGEGWE